MTATRPTECDIQSLIDQALQNFLNGDKAIQFLEQALQKANALNQINSLVYILLGTIYAREEEDRDRAEDFLRRGLLSDRSGGALLKNVLVTTMPGKQAPLIDYVFLAFTLCFGSAEIEQHASLAKGLASDKRHDLLQTGFYHSTFAIWMLDNEIEQKIDEDKKLETQLKYFNLRVDLGKKLIELNLNNDRNKTFYTDCLDKDVLKIQEITELMAEKSQKITEELNAAEDKKEKRKKTKKKTKKNKTATAQQKEEKEAPVDPAAKDRPLNLSIDTTRNSTGMLPVSTEFLSAGAASPSPSIGSEPHSASSVSSGSSTSSARTLSLLRTPNSALISSHKTTKLQGVPSGLAPSVQREEEVKQLHQQLSLEHQSKTTLLNKLSVHEYNVEDLRRRLKNEKNKNKDLAAQVAQLTMQQQSPAQIMQAPPQEQPSPSALPESVAPTTPSSYGAASAPIQIFFSPPPSLTLPHLQSLLDANGKQLSITDPFTGEPVCLYRNLETGGIVDCTGRGNYRCDTEGSIYSFPTASNT